MSKTALIALSTLVLASGTAMAHPGGKGKHGGGVNPYERAQIARSAANLAAIKQRAWRDGRLSFIEKFQIRNAERRHAALVARARHS